MTEFKPLNLAQIYQAADASVAQAMQTNLLVLQSSRMKQEFDEEDQLRSLARSSTTTGPDGTPSFDLKTFTKGAYAVNPMKAMGFEKAQREAEKTSLERENLQGQIDERRMKGAADRLRLMNEASTVPFLKYKELVEGGVDDVEARKQVQPIYVQAIQNLVSSGAFKPEQIAKFDLAPEFDPTKAEAGMRQVLGAKDALAQFWEEKKFGQKEKQHKESLQVQIRGQNITLRGQNLTDARAKEDLAVKGLDVKENEDGTYSVIDKKTGEATPVLGADGQPMKSPKGLGTQEERVASGYASRMAAAEKVLSGIKVGDQKTGFVEGIAGAAPFVGEWQANWIRGDDRQKALQAQRDWVRAKLRKESGAVIADEEMDEEIRTYFPQIGDSEKVIKQKADARKRANEGMAKAAGKAYAPPKKEAKPKDDKPGQPQEGQTSTSKSGKPIVYRNGRWEYAD